MRDYFYQELYIFSCIERFCRDIPKLMKKMFTLVCTACLAFFNVVDAAFIGNPSQPFVQKTGLVKETPCNWSFRLSYFGDYVYEQSFHNEISINDQPNPISNIQMWTQAGMLTFNMANRVDIYAILGGSRIDGFDTDTPQDLSWGAGVKVNFYNYKRWRLGCDFKYFATNFYPNFIKQNNLAYNLVTDLTYEYYELQGAAGISYFTKHFSPYINGTYLQAKLTPTPNEFVMQSPTKKRKVSGEIETSINSNHFGLAIGATILDLRKASINIEWRAINQNAINVNGEFRF